jgi:hypothetical protein
MSIPISNERQLIYQPNHLEMALDSIKLVFVVVPRGEHGWSYCSHFVEQNGVLIGLFSLKEGMF